MGNTYGTWPLGDERGFRTRRHRWHVEGDYRFPPPPGYYQRLLMRSKRLMKREMVVFDPQVRGIVGEQFVASLTHYGVEVVALSMSAMHFHLIARFVPVGVEPYQHLRRIGIKLTHERYRPTPGGRGRSAYDLDPVPRRILGLVKSYVTHEMKRCGVVAIPDGGLWGKRPLCLPISGREHQVACTRYIHKHEREGAAVLLPPHLHT